MPKYACKILWQLYIFDTETVNPQLQEAYLTNMLVNLWKLLQRFYKMDLLLKYQNSKFKRFQSDQRYFCKNLISDSVCMHWW